MRRLHVSIGKTEVERIGDGLTIKVLTNEHKLLHSVTVTLIPVGLKGRVLLLKVAQLVSRHRGIPHARTLQTLLIACLLKEEAIVRIILKPAQALATYDTFWPFACHEIVKIVHVERTATAIDKRANAIFFNLATLMVVMMMVVMTTKVVVFMLVFMLMFVLVFVLMLVLVLMLVFVLVLVFMLMLMLVLVFVLMLVLIMLLMRFLQLFYPCCRCGHLVKNKLMGVEQTLEVYVSIVARDNLCFRLDSANDLAHMQQFVSAHLRCFVQQDGVAKLYLLNDEVLNVLLINIFLCESIAALKLVAHAKGVNNRHDTVETRHAVFYILRTERRERADGLCYRCRLTDAARLDNDIIETFHGNDIVKLLHKIHLQCAADTSVLQSHKAIVLLVHDATLLNEVCIDINLSYVVHNDGKLNAFLVCENAVEQCRADASN